MKTTLENTVFCKRQSVFVVAKFTLIICCFTTLLSGCEVSRNLEVENTSNVPIVLVRKYESYEDKVETYQIGTVPPNSNRVFDGVLPHRADVLELDIMDKKGNSLKHIREKYEDVIDNSSGGTWKIRF